MDGQTDRRMVNMTVAYTALAQHDVAKSVISDLVNASN